MAVGYYPFLPLVIASFIIVFSPFTQLGKKSERVAQKLFVQLPRVDTPATNPLSKRHSNRT